ncbi:MAG: DUF4832 domain-containing protein [Clostridiales bacterium]|nr:DUF4832 domain-containing protein [Clostridiales bacterium]
MKKAMWFAARPHLDEGKGRFIDLRHYQDDRRILNNPHKGWCWHYVDGGFGDVRYNAQGELVTLIAYADGYQKIHEDGHLEILDDVSDFPGLNHLYIRFNWGDIEKEEGKCDWTPIDRIMDEWGKKGYTFAFRPCTFQGNLFPATPDWVIAAGAKTRPFFIDNMWTNEPVYDDPIYLEKLSRFISEMGAKFDGDPRVEYVDIGTFGHWGEANASILYPVESIMKHLEMHVNAFPHTVLAFNYAFVIGRMEREMAPGEGQKILDWAKEKGMVVRNDSICYQPYIENGNYHSLLAPSLHDELYENGPAVLEFVHHWQYEDCFTHNGESAFEEGYRAVAACERSRATFAGFHGYPRDIEKKYGPMLRYLTNRLGYWYFIEGIQLPSWKAGERAECTLYLTNRGFARAYHKYDLKLKLLPAAGGEVIILDCPDADTRTWIPKGVPSMDNAVAQQLQVDLTGVQPGEYQLQLGLFAGDRPVHFGIFQDYEQDGWVPVGNVKIEA